VSMEISLIKNVARVKGFEVANNEIISN